MGQKPPIPRMKCPTCRMWIDAPSTARTVPQHEDPTGADCAGRGRPPAARRGPVR